MTSLSDETFISECNNFVIEVKDVKEAIKDILEFPAGNVEALKQKIRVRCGKELCSEEKSE